MITSIYVKKMSKALFAGGFIFLNMTFLPSVMAAPQSDPVAETKCALHVQSKVVWDSSDKSRSWARKYITKLCKGVSVRTHKEPGVCHTTVQRGNAWNTTRHLKGQKSWGATQVVGLCAGASDGAERASCFESKAANDGWAKAIKACKKSN